VPTLALAVVAIALPDSLNPTLIVGAVYLALGPRAVRRTLAFTLAAFAVTLAGGLAIALGLGDLISALLPHLSHDVKWSVLTAVGILLVAGAVVLWWRRDAVAHALPAAPAEGRASGSAWLMGAGVAGVELLSAFPYFGAIAMVLGASVSVANKISLIVLYNVVYIAPLLAVVVIAAAMGEQAGRVLQPISDWISRRWPIVVAPLAGAVGIALTVWGIVELVA